MARVFLSYDRDDGAKARAIAQALERAGHFVWWDLHIKGGAEYGREIERALEQSDAVAVLWSSRSINSAWVRDEAAAGRDSGRLVPILIEPVSPPMGFRQYQNLDFSAWKGRGKPPRMADLLDSITAVGEPSTGTQQSTRTRTPYPPPRTSMSPLLKWSLIGGTVMFVLVALSFVLQRDLGEHGVYTVAVSAADDSAGPLARDLLVNLGRLQSATTGALRLVSGNNKSEKADLVFEAAGNDESGKASANLVLMDGGDRSVLWSQDFDQPSGKVADLKQQIAFTAARVLSCAFDGLNADDGRLKQQTLRIYLSGCSRMAGIASTEPAPVASIMEKVLADSPRFKPAWGILLRAQTGNIGETTDPGQPRARAQMRQLIEKARSVDPTMPELTLAEISLLPTSEFGQALRLADKAHTQSPDNSDVLSTRSNLLRRVGRMRESIVDASHAAELDPLSPWASNNYVSALFYGGRFEAARQELARIAQLWPGTESVIEVSYRFHLRYGDPKEALRIAQAGGTERGMELFLNARIDPSSSNLANLKAFMDKRVQDRGATGLSYAMQTSGQFGWEDDIYQLLLSWPHPDELADVADVYFRPTLAKFRSDPRFMRVAKRAGLVDYWQESGEWPDFCLDADLPYDCKAEAAKVS